MIEVYRARTIKRARRTAEELAQLDRQILEEVKSDHPQSVRHVFYRMTNPRLPEPVEKSQRGYRHVQERCVKLRRGGRLPFGWISDATRRGYFTNTYASGSDFLRSVAGFYRSDLWAQASRRCEVWVESRSIAGVVQQDCEELAVSLYPAGGFSSITFAHDAAQTINDAASVDGRGTVVLYIGDYDPAGVLIDVALETELRAHLHRGVELDFQRIAINPYQIELYDLPAKPRKTGDKRSASVKETVEAEAMPAHILRRMLRAHIEGMLPQGALDVVRVAEESERAHILHMADVMETLP